MVPSFQLTISLQVMRECAFDKKSEMKNDFDWCDDSIEQIQFSL